MPSAVQASSPGSYATPTSFTGSRIHVSGLAYEVLRAIEAREAAGQPTICKSTLDILVNAVLDPTVFDPADAVAQMLARGATHRDIADHYVPAAACNLGDCWLSDELGFARVTVGSGRLQELLGHLVQANDLNQAWERATPRVALISLHGDDHSLGWKLLTLQLRRQGVSVDALPCVRAEEGADLIEQIQADLVLVSASRLSAIGIVAEITATLRARMEPVPPIVLGGLVTRHLEPETSFPDIVCITNDLAVALSHGRRKPTPLRSRIG